MQHEVGSVHVSFACQIVAKAGCGRGQGSAMNSPGSALTAVLAGLTDAYRQAKEDPELRHRASGILSIELVQISGRSVTGGAGELKPHLQAFQSR